MFLNNSLTSFGLILIEKSILSNSSCQYEFLTLPPTTYTSAPFEVKIFVIFKISFLNNQEISKGFEFVNL